MSITETPDLLFFDTFSHDTSEELNLDLVQFPKSVYVREIRIIPLGARVEGDFAGGVRLGATNPTKFHIDFFVNDLSKPGASTFEALGSLEYCQNGQIHMECSSDLDQPRIPTDGLVLKGWYTTITLAVYGNLTQVIPETPIGVNPPPPTPRPAVIREPPPVQQPVAQNPEWTPEPVNPIPAYTGNVAVVQPDVYGPNNYPDNYDNPYRAEYYEADAPKDPRTYLHVEDTEWEKRDISCEREGDRLRRSSRSMELERERERRDGRSRRRSIDRRSRESSRLRDRSRDERLDRPHSRSRSRDREYIVKGEYRPVSRSRSRSLDRPRSLDRLRTSADRDWDRASYKKDDYRRHRDASYDRSRAGSYDKDAASYGRRSPYEKRAPSYERKGPYEKRPSPYEKRGSSYEKQSPYERKRHSPYSRIRGSSYGSRSPSRDEPRKRPRTPPADAARRPLSPHADLASPAVSPRSEEPEGYDRSGKQIPRVDFYHQSYRHKSSIRSPSEEGERPPYPEPAHSSLVTVQLVDTPPAKAAESPVRPDEDKSMDAEQFEPILSDEDICDDLEGSSYTEVEYELNEYCGVDDIIKYYNPFKTEWTRYEYVNKIHLLNDREGTKDVLSASFEELCELSPDLFKLSEIAKSNDLPEQKVAPGTFLDVENSAREDWVHQCEQVFVSLTNLCKHTDIILRVFPEDGHKGAPDEFTEVSELLMTFCRIGLTFELALAQQQPTYKIRHMKCGIRLAEALTSHAHNERVTKVLLESGIDLPMSLLEIYSKEYMALSIRLMILKALNACLASKLAVDNFMRERMFPKFDKDEERKPKNGYCALVSILQANPLTRIKFAVSALIKKLNLYELLAKLHELVVELDSSGGAELSERDVDFIVNALDELLHTLRSRSFHISQPKRFLPVSAQFDIGKECSNEGVLRLFSVHRTLPALLYLVTSPATCGALPVVSPVHDLLHELVHSETGLDFLYRHLETAELLFRALVQAEGQAVDEAGFPHDLTGYTDLQLLALEMAYRLRALHHLRSIGDLQAGAPDENDLIDRLQALYCLGFGGIGRTAVPDVVVMGDNAECLVEVFEADLKAKKTEPPSKRKSPAKGYAVELIAAAVRYSADVPFLKRYAQRLAAAARDHERFEPSVGGVLQEMGPYLRPVERPGALAGEELAELVETVRASAEHAADLPGELTTALRVLLHLCVPAHAADDHAELRYKYHALQLYSLEGGAALAAVLERLAARYEQPGVHAACLAAARGLQLAQLLLPCLRLLDELLARAVRARGPRYRDLTAAPVLLRAYGLARAFPAGCVARRTAARAARAAVRALLAYAQPIADDAHDGAALRRGPWSSLCSEVISYTMTAPHTFVPGLLVLSELLPLPLPLQTRVRPTARELADAAAERRLWSAHLHALAGELTDMIQIICTSSYRPVVHVLRRVCVQVADLAANTAGTVARAALGAVLRELRPGEPAAAGAARVLGFLACLVSHAPVKCAVLHALHAGGPRAADVQSALCGVLTVSHASNEHAAAQEFAAHALAALCDIDVTLTPAAGELLVSNSLPGKEALAAFLEATAACLQSTTETCAVAQSILRAYFVLTCHEYGFQQFRKFVAKKREALGKFFRWCLEGTGEERAECLSLYIDLIRILRGEEGEGTPGGRRSLLSSQDMADMVGFTPGDDQHPVLKLDAILKERNSEDDAAAGALLASQLSRPLSPRGGAESPEPPAPPAPLPAQFMSRTLHTTAGVQDDRLTATFWLNVPVLNDDDEHDTDLVPCDLVELANSEVISGGAALCAAVRRLAGCLDTRAETRTHDDKRPAVALSRVRSEGVVDAFRSRPPNTSRPPSLHVDDFTALHRVYSHNNNRGMRRGAAGGERGRFGTQPAPAHYRHLRGRGAWEMGGSHFGHFAPSSQYMMGGMGWGGGRMQRGPRHRSFMR